MFLVLMCLGNVVDLPILHRLNTLLTSVSLPTILDILDATPYLLIRLYELLPIPPLYLNHHLHQPQLYPLPSRRYRPRIRYVIRHKPSDSRDKKLRNLKLLIGTLVHDKNVGVEEEVVERLVEADLVGFVDGELGSVREVLEGFLRIVDPEGEVEEGGETEVVEELVTPRKAGRVMGAGIGILEGKEETVQLDSAFYKALAESVGRVLGDSGVRVKQPPQLQQMGRGYQDEGIQASILESEAEESIVGSTFQATPRAKRHHSSGIISSTPKVPQFHYNCMDDPGDTPLQNNHVGESSPDSISDDLSALPDDTSELNFSQRYVPISRRPQYNRPYPESASELEPESEPEPSLIHLPPSRSTSPYSYIEDLLANSSDEERSISTTTKNHTPTLKLTPSYTRQPKAHYPSLPPTPTPKSQPSYSLKPPPLLPHQKLDQSRLRSPPSPASTTLSATHPIPNFTRLRCGQSSRQSSPDTDTISVSSVSSISDASSTVCSELRRVRGAALGRLKERRVREAEGRFNAEVQGDVRGGWSGSRSISGGDTDEESGEEEVVMVNKEDAKKILFEAVQEELERLGLDGDETVGFEEIVRRVAGEMGVGVEGE